MTMVSTLLFQAANACKALRLQGFSNFTVNDGDTGVCLELGARPGAITSYWRPQDDSAHGAQLEADLEIDVCWSLDYVTAIRRAGPGGPVVSACELADFPNRQAARRMAALQTAAKVGRFSNKR